jgi:hypothetical protein
MSVNCLRLSCRPDVPAHGVSFGEAFKVWLRVALLSFRGPAVEIALVHRILIEERRWISEAALSARAQLQPSPAETGSAAAGHLYRLAHAQDDGRPHGRRALRRPRIFSKLVRYIIPAKKGGGMTSGLRIRPAVDGSYRGRAIPRRVLREMSVPERP